MYTKRNTQLLELHLGPAVMLKGVRGGEKPGRPSSWPNPFNYRIYIKPIIEIRILNKFEKWVFC